MIKSFSKIFFALVFMISLAQVARAERVTKYFGQVEFWSEGGAYKADQKDANTLINTPGSPYKRKNTDISNGSGVRLGFMRPTGAEGLTWGASLGYVMAPKGEIDVRDNLTPPVEQAKQSSKTSFIRAMLEVKKAIPVTDRLAIGYGAGLGLAQGRTKMDFNSIGTFVDSVSDSKSWVGLSWEVSPLMFSFKTTSLDFNLGFVLSGFPVMKESTNFDKFKWVPFGVQVGVGF